ncbi:unnamed protein product [Toxocara canis]|uniref:Protein phosphatase 1 regulatory subunit 7 n=1 Tax=Toxocara canis TaxID=6265 RepID=A0A183UMQ1_TOXCA|nr:unnamed protein product [Toxocara canis]
MSEGSHCLDAGEEVPAEDDEIDMEAESLSLIRRRIRKIENYGRMKNLKSLCLRWNLISKIENLDGLNHLRNRCDTSYLQISEIAGLESLVTLEVLDMSFNRIAKIGGLDTLVNLKALYLVHNKIRKIENLRALKKLELLELGDNHIQCIENVNGLKRLQKLFLGANQIRTIENLDELTSLTVLSLPGNAITKIEGCSLSNFTVYASPDSNTSIFDGGSAQTRLQIKTIDCIPANWIPGDPWQPLHTTSDEETVEE